MNFMRSLVSLSQLSENARSQRYCPHRCMLEHVRSHNSRGSSRSGVGRRQLARGKLQSNRALLISESVMQIQSTKRTLVGTLQPLQQTDFVEGMMTRQFSPICEFAVLLQAYGAFLPNWCQEPLHREDALDDACRRSSLVTPSIMDMLYSH